MARIPKGRKPYPKRRLEVMLEHYGTLKDLAGAAFSSPTAVRNWIDGHPPSSTSRARLDHAWDGVPKELRQRPSKPRPSAGPYDKERLLAMVRHFGTQSALARACGLDQATVSRAIRGFGTTAPTKMRLDAVWEGLGLEAKPVEPAATQATIDRIMAQQRVDSDALTEVIKALDAVSLVVTALAGELGVDLPDEVVASHVMPPRVAGLLEIEERDVSTLQDGCVRFVGVYRRVSG